MQTILNEESHMPEVRVNVSPNETVLNTTDFLLISDTNGFMLGRMGGSYDFPMIATVKDCDHVIALCERLKQVLAK